MRRMRQDEIHQARALSRQRQHAQIAARRGFDVANSNRHRREVAVDLHRQSAPIAFIAQPIQSFGRQLHALRILVKQARQNIVRGPAHHLQLVSVLPQLANRRFQIVRPQPIFIGRFPIRQQFAAIENRRFIRRRAESNVAVAFVQFERLRQTINAAAQIYNRAISGFEVANFIAHAERSLKRRGLGASSHVAALWRNPEL